MSQVLEEVENAIDVLGLTEEVVLVKDGADILYKSLLDAFVDSGDRRWWWEAFTSPSESIIFDDEKGFERLLKLVPDIN
jgi:hypothetical protein